MIMNCLTIDVTLCVGGSKASAGQYILYCPAARAISRPGNEGNIQILPGKVAFSYLLIHPLIQPFIFRLLQ